MKVADHSNIYIQVSSQETNAKKRITAMAAALAKHFGQEKKTVSGAKPRWRYFFHTPVKSEKRSPLPKFPH